MDAPRDRGRGRTADAAPGLGYAAGVTVLEVEHRDYRDTLKRCTELGGADLIVTSPPYPDARSGQYGGDAPHDWTWPDYQALGDAVMAGLRPGGFCAINIDGPVRHWRKGVGSERSMIAFRLALDWAERVGLRYVEHCAYVRDAAPGVFGDRWRSGWEPVHVFQRPGPSAVDMGAYRLPAVQAGVRQASKRMRTGSGWNATAAHVTAPTRTLTTAIASPLNSGYIDQAHPAPFSHLLADAFVLCYSRPGGLVCDPFVGSGTVAISAAKHGRQFVGGDLGERLEDLERGRTRARWADVARERMLAAVPPAPAAQAA